MAVNETKTAGGFQLSIDLFQRSVVDLHFRTALAADQVVVVMLGNLIDKMAAAHMGGTCQAILSQEFQRAIHGRFSQTREYPGWRVRRLRLERDARPYDAAHAGSPSAGESCESRVRVVGECIG